MKHYGGLFLPLIDLYAPTAAELATAHDTLTELRSRSYPPKLQNVAEHGLEWLQAAEQARGEHDTFLKENNIVMGNKRPLDEAEREQVAGWFSTMRTAATGINKAAEFLGRPEARMQVRHVGGTVGNKLHGLKSALGDNVTAHMYGLTGTEDDERNLTFLTEQIFGVSRLKFQQPSGETLDRITQNYVILGEEAARINLQSEVSRVGDKLRGHEEEIERFIEPLDTVLVEGSDIGEIKFGREVFTHFTDTALRMGKEIIFAAPTNLKLVLGAGEEIEQNRATFDRIIGDPHTSVLTMNEEEAVAYFCNEKLERTEGDALTAHAQVEAALAAIQQRLQEKEAAGHSPVEPLALVSIGPEGAYAITPHTIKHLRPEKVNQPTDALGAGDGFVAGALVARDRILSRKQPGADGVVRYEVPTDLDTMLQQGQRLACAVVGHKGTQVPPAEIAQLFHGDVPSQVVVSAVDVPGTKQEAHR